MKLLVYRLSYFWMILSLVFCIAICGLCKYIETQTDYDTVRDGEMGTILADYGNLIYQKDQAMTYARWVEQENRRLNKELKWHGIRPHPPNF